MKYCEDDIRKARMILTHIQLSTEDMRKFHPVVKLTDEERSAVINGIHTLENILQYAKDLDDDKLNKIIKMKKIIKEGDK